MSGLPTALEAETARAIFFGLPPSHSMPPVRPTLSFFALVAGAFALGTVTDRKTAGVSDPHVHDNNGHGDKMTIDDPSSYVSANGITGYRHQKINKYFSLIFCSLAQLAKTTKEKPSKDPSCDKTCGTVPSRNV
ncbi:hypothetical protein BV22DRAFT_851161 [Leucogyrophana mollusca]|uniref:Uncharacterized protein n=1 Tax=Leucogyrophana mollusca TaxID=85980 RepID=A0ACB8B1C6_9AGAM|nr:hypothetical protein BV22DRAFT_851161 [Leucogyrophana mollusca]